jgi:hypothetical protein
MSARQAFRHARSLLRGGGDSVLVRVDGIWLHVEPTGRDGEIVERWFWLLLLGSGVEDRSRTEGTP